MSQEIKEKGVQKESALENPEVLIEKLSGFESFVEKNTRLLGAIVGLVVVLTGGWFGYKWYIGEQNKEAEAMLFPLVYYFEADSLDKAMKGDGTSPGFPAIADEYSGTPAANLASFYAGTIYLKQQKFDEAIEYLSRYSSGDLLIQPRAHCLLGDAYMEKNDLPKALEYYKKAALHAPNKYYSPRYLMKAGLVQELMKNYSEAANTYRTVLEKYYDSQEALDAKRLKGRCEQLLESAK